jgi:fatty acid desaturase
VTTSHQSEELLFEPEHDWVRMQFRTTRDAEPSNPLWAWLWGGMQHQLEHHLFPTMPRYRYTALIPVIRDFAAQHDLPYKSEGALAIWLRTWRNYCRVAAAPAVPGAKAPRKGVTI